MRYALTFEIAAKACFREGIRKAAPQLLEPVMKVETVTPGDYLGDVIGDMNRRRGTILDQIERGANIAVVATVPLSEMFGYIGQLRSTTSGRASFTMEFRTTIRCRRTLPTKSSPKCRSARQLPTRKRVGTDLWSVPLIPEFASKTGRASDRTEAVETPALFIFRPA